MIATAFRVAEDKGVQFSGIDEGSDLISQLSPVWQENKDELKQATVKQTYQILEGIIQP